MCSLRNQFDPVFAHHNEKFHVLRAVGFFIAISLPPYLSFNLLHPRSRSFARRFAPSNDVRCGTSSILFSPTIMKASCASRRDAFFLPFPSHLIYHLTSCIRAHDHLRVALLLQMMFAAEPVRSCFRPPKRRPHVICSMGSFFLPFSFFLYSHITSCIRDSLHFAPRFAPSKCVRCGTSSILFSPTIMKSSTCSAPWDFLLSFLLRSG